MVGSSSTVLLGSSATCVGECATCSVLLQDIILFLSRHSVRIISYVYNYGTNDSLLEGSLDNGRWNHRTAGEGCHWMGTP